MDFDFGEINPISVVAGLICGAVVFAMMGNTGGVDVGIVFRIAGFAIGGVVGYLVFNTMMNR